MLVYGLCSAEFGANAPSIVLHMQCCMHAYQYFGSPPSSPSLVVLDCLLMTRRSRLHARDSILMTLRSRLHTRLSMSELCPQHWQKQKPDCCERLDLRDSLLKNSCKGASKTLRSRLHTRLTGLWHSRLTHRPRY